MVSIKNSTKMQYCSFESQKYMLLYCSWVTLSLNNILKSDNWRIVTEKNFRISYNEAQPNAI